MKGIAAKKAICPQREITLCQRPVGNIPKNEELLGKIAIGEHDLVWPGH